MVESIAKIRRDFHVRKKGVREIARDRKVSRNTVRKVIREGETEFRYERGEQPLPKMAGHLARLEGLLAANAKAPRKQRRTIKQLHGILCAEGYEGTYRTVCRHAERWRERHALEQSSAFVPLQFRPGEAYQFDWSEEHVVIGGMPRKLRLAQMKLCYSRHPYVRAYPRETQEMVFDAHNRAFSFYGGSCERGIYDNMSTAVVKVKAGRERLWNRRFEQMCSHFLVEPQACTPAAGWEKGRVEKQVLDLRRSLLAPDLRFDSMDDFNAHLEAGFQRYAKNARHPEFRSKSVHEVFLEERGSLIPFAGEFDGWSAATAVASKCLLVSFDKNRYSAAANAKGRVVEVRAYSDRIEIRLDGEAVGVHSRSFGRGETIYDPLHYLPVLRKKPGALRNGAPFSDWRLPPAMQRVRDRLSGFSDGDRQMVAILSAAQHLGFEALELACEKALADGCSHADVILNHARVLTQPEAAEALPEPAHIRLGQPPEADCRRYDELIGGGP